MVCFVAYEIIYSKNINVAHNFELTEEEFVRLPLEIDGLHSFVYLYNEDIIYQTIFNLISNSSTFQRHIYSMPNCVVDTVIVLATTHKEQEGDRCGKGYTPAAY